MVCAYTWKCFSLNYLPQLGHNNVSVHLFFSLDHSGKEKDRQKKKEKNKEWKKHKLPPVHDIVRENGEVMSPQKGRNLFRI